MKPRLPVLFLFLGLFANSIAQDQKYGLFTLADLPPHLRFEEGKMNLVVDYAAAMAGSAPLYVVNATDRPQPFVYLHPVLRETLGDDGVWRRCDPDVPPWCLTGVPLGVKIPPSGIFEASLRLNDDKGERRRVRYSQYVETSENFAMKWTTNLISNEGLGVVDPAEVEASRFDHIGAALGPLEDVARIALKQVPQLDRPGLPWGIALRRLSMWEKDPRRIDVLKQVITKAREENDREVYSMALAGLRKASPLEWTEEAYWKFAVAEINSGQPLSSVAFEKLMADLAFAERKRPLLDQIIANPRHPNLEIAMREYSSVAGTVAAEKMAQRVSRSSKYPETAKTAAKKIIAKLQPAP